MRSKRKFTVEFKKKLVEDIRAGVLSMAQACRQNELNHSLVYRWTDQYEHGKLENDPSEKGALENKVAELERKIGQQAMEIDLLKKAREHYARSLREKSSAPALREISANGARS